MKNENKKQENEFMNCVWSGVMGFAFAMYIIFVMS